MYLNANNNPNLSCINVDNTLGQQANWTMIDPQHYFSNNCILQQYKNTLQTKNFLK